MALWQIDFYLLPRAAYITNLPHEPRHLTSEEFELIRNSAGHRPPLKVVDQIAGFMLEIESWHRDLKWFGSEEGERVDIWFDKNLVRSLDFRIDVRRLDIMFIHLMVDVALQCDGLFCSSWRGAVLKPTRNLLLHHILDSAIANEAWDWCRTGSMATYPKIFLCHSSLDEPFVNKLAEDLRAENLPVWYDKWELEVGDSLHAKISEGIEDSSFLAAVLSKNSIKSDWVARELNSGLVIELEKRDVFVLPIVIDDCRIPLFLRDKVYADFRSSYDAGLEAILRRVRTNKS